MTKEERIQIVRETIDTKYDIMLALQKLECKTGIEIGVRLGHNLKRLAASPYFVKGKMYGLDCWAESEENPTQNDQDFSQQQLDAQYKYVVDRFAGIPYVEIVRDFSTTGAARFEDNYFDFCYIDAAHDYESVMEDLKAWWPKMKEGGLFSGHDYIPDYREWRGVPVGVKQAVDEFCVMKGTEVHHVTDTEMGGGPGVACNSFFIIK